MTLYQLEIALSVAKHLSFAAAAKEHHIGQSAVSQQLKHLKEEYGVILFKKRGRGFELTQTGQLFLKNAKSILTQVRKLEQNFKKNYGNTRSFMIGGSHAASESLLPLLSAHYKGVNPIFS